MSVPTRAQLDQLRRSFAGAGRRGLRIYAKLEIRSRTELARRF